LLEKQFQPAIVEHLATLAELAREDEHFWMPWRKSACERRFEKTRGEHGSRSRNDSIEEEERILRRERGGHRGAEKTEGKAALSKRMIRRIVESIKPLSGQLGAAHVEAVLQLARGGRNGSSLALPGGVKVRKERDALVFLAVENARSQTLQDAAREMSTRSIWQMAKRKVSVAELVVYSASG